MALQHATSGEVVEVRPRGSRIGDAPSTAIVLDGNIEVMRLMLPTGKSVSEHAVAGPMTLHCLEGAVDVRAYGSSRPMRAGDLMYLAGGVPHALYAIEDAFVLATVVRLPPA
ncbi:MAG: cupin [Burkholderiales bacterium]|nr:MAG: cupin [Burkholderiales bacterium]